MILTKSAKSRWATYFPKGQAPDLAKALDHSEVISEQERQHYAFNSDVTGRYPLDYPQFVALVQRDERGEVAIGFIARHSRFYDTAEPEDAPEPEFDAISQEGSVENIRSIRNRIAAAKNWISAHPREHRFRKSYAEELARLQEALETAKVDTISIHRLETDSRIAALENRIRKLEAILHRLHPEFPFEKNDLHPPLPG